MAHIGFFLGLHMHDGNQHGSYCLGLRVGSLVGKGGTVWGLGVSELRGLEFSTLRIVLVYGSLYIALHNPH